jgi:uncharacterized SAM-binding protein YcdF (DUF218 family)
MQTGMGITRTRAGKRGLIAAAAAVTLLLLVVLAMGQVGRLLLVTDTLEHAQSVAVLGGGVPFRAMEAAVIYREGWAPEVWLTRNVRHPDDVALAKLGIERMPEDAYNRVVLERLGVPDESIRLLDRRILNTAEEVRLIADEVGKRGGDRVILVTSKYHARRLKFLWLRLVGDHPRAIVRYARDDPFDPNEWWHTSRDAMAVSREVFGVLNAWAGFPVRSEP